MIYAGFWRRLLSQTTDAVVLVPVMYLHIRYGYSSRMVLAISTVAFFLLANAYTVFFLTRWGQTLGKMLAGIRVTRLDGAPIGIRQALLRGSGDILLGALGAFGTLYAVVTWSGLEWSTLSRHELSSQLLARNPIHGFALTAIEVWYWGELVVLLFNKKKRALHDFIAGTVVIRTGSEPTAIAPAMDASARRA